MSLKINENEAKVFYEASELSAKRYEFTVVEFNVNN